MPVTINGTTGIAGPDGSASTPAVQGTDSNTGLFFPAADTVAITTGGTQRVTVDSSGNVGIGLGGSSPARLLDAQKDQNSATQFRIRNDNNGTASQASVSASYGDFTQYVTMAQYSPSFTTSGLRVANSSGVFTIGNTNGLRVYTLDSTPLIFGTADTERARITSGGNLLVGATSNSAQSEKLQVTGNIGMTVSTPQINFYGTGSTIEFVNRDSGGAKTFSWYYTASGGGPPATLSTSGVWTNASDARGKENISEIHYGLDTVMALYPRQYDVKSDGSHAIGFVAQEVLPVVPELVHVTRRTENDEFYGLDYGSMTAVLVKAIQELKADFDATKAELAALKGA